MDIKLSCNHINYLSYKYVRNIKENRCEECGGEIWGNAFTCLRCRVWLHASCSEKLHRNPPRHEILHPLHLQHQLILERNAPDFICDKCLRISVGYRYSCSSCDFNLDFACASSVDDRFPKDQESLRSKDGTRKRILHYSHSHRLSFFRYKKTDEEDYYDCFWCEKHLSEVCYGCLNCGFYLHQTCADKVPRTLCHPFHPDPGHILRLSYIQGYCSACKNIFGSFSPSYMCQMCSFRLDFDCAKLTPTLKLDCHHHLLTYFRDFGNDYERHDFYCKACDKHCGGASSYRCVQCHFSIHLTCVIPSSAKHRYHRHPLLLIESVKEDDSGEYYCDVCEMERNPKQPVYCCQSCTFIGHIECVLDEDQISSKMVPSPSPESIEKKALFVNEMERNEGTNAIGILIQPNIHSHNMYEVTEELKEKTICYGCRLALNGPSYFCKTCPEFFLHEKCATLPCEIQHPFHSSHPLNLYTSYHPWIGRYITCDECRDICFGFIYICERCNFKLDVKCAALIAHRTGVLHEKETDRVTEFHHFSHHHKLVLGYCNDPIDKTNCMICESTILGPAYFCPELYCDCILHESCLKIPQKIQVPFHPEHMLVINVFKEHSKPKCYACSLNLKLDTLAYSCEQCQLSIHPICANSLRRPLKCESHLDDLYYFGTNFQLLYANNNWPWLECYECKHSCEGEAFYRSIQSQINFHLKCVPIPDIVKSKYHRHPLTLKDSFVEDDSGKYYCNFCEEERNPKDHVYYCQECNGRTIAHIECVLAQVENNMVEIRKNFREESLQKRREGLQAQPMPASLHSTAEKKLENLPAMVAGVWADDRNLQLEATIQFRKLLSIESTPFIEDVIQVGVVPCFIEFLLKEDFPQLQVEAAWTLTNIASGTLENTKVLIDHGAVPIFVKLLGSPSDDDVREQVVWALGNVAADCSRFRDLVLGHGALLPLLAQLNEHAKLSMLRRGTWALKILCSSKPKPPFDQVKLALPTLARLIHSIDGEVLTNVCRALSNLSEGTNDKIQVVIEAGVCGPLVELLLHPSPKVLVPTLRTVGNIITGDDEQTQCIVSRQALPCLFNLLTNNYEKIVKKEACWAISNITAGNKEQIQAVIEANIIAPLVHLLQNAEFDIKKEAAWAIANATTGGTRDQIKFLVSQGCIKPLCDLLTCPDPEIVTVCLKGLKNILEVGEADKTKGSTGGVNLYAQMIEDAEGLEKIKDLQAHDNSEIHEKAVNILETILAGRG